MKKNNIQETLSILSKKISIFSNTQTPMPKIEPSKNKKLQDQINNYEKEKAELLRKQFLDYQNPMTSDIEQDEQSLLKAYEIFTSIIQLTKSIETKETYLANKKIMSPLCKKYDYTHSNKFSFLRIWFIKNNPESNLVPVIEKFDTNFLLNFITSDDYKFTSFEKEILQAIEPIKN